MKLQVYGKLTGMLRITKRDLVVEWLGHNRPMFAFEIALVVLAQIRWSFCMWP